MARPRENKGKLYQCREGFTTDVDGMPVTVTVGELVREGHPLLLGRMSLFQPVEVQYDYEQATSNPGESRR